MGQCPYRRIRPLGEGAVGDVHLCIDAIKRRLVVVKWLRSEVQPDSEAAKRFRREAELMAGASLHGGVVQVEGFGVDNMARTWMAMEFVDGQTPSSVIRAGDAWALHQLLQGLARSLDELHGLGVVHRDLKPENIILRSTPTGWEPVIIDLGIAKWLSEETSTATGTVFGTPYYMSPEQFRDSKNVGPATDRYALAVIAYELLTGHLPYGAKNFLELMRQHLEFPIPSLSVPQLDTADSQGATRPARTDPGLQRTPALDRYIQIAMAKGAGQRYSSSAELAEAFQRAAQSDGIWREPPFVQPLFPALTHPIVELESEEGVQRFDLREGPVAMGRHEGCQFRLSSPRLSRLHAVIYTQRGRPWLADLHSQNGSYCDGKRVEVGSPIPLPIGGGSMRVQLYDRPIRLRLLPVGAER